MSSRSYTFLVALACMAAFISASYAAESTTGSSSGSTNNGHRSSSSSSSSSTTATQSRQSPISMAASMVGALGSLVPGLITNVAPLVLLFGIGALMMPSLGMSAMGLLRESRRSANDQPTLANVQFTHGGGAGLPGAGPNPFAQFAARPIQTSPQDIYYFTKRSLPSLSSFNSAPLFELLERVARAIDNADKRYN